MWFGLYRIKVFNNLRFTENQAWLSIVYCMHSYTNLKDLICLFSSYLISNQEVKGKEKKVLEQIKKTAFQSSEKHCNSWHIQKTQKSPSHNWMQQKRRLDTILYSCRKVP